MQNQKEMEKGKTAFLASSAVGVAIVVLSIVPVRIGAAAGATMTERLAHPFCHANIFHAAANAWCLVSIAHAYRVTVWELLAAYAIAVSVPSFVLSATPTMGLSGACFALIGMMLRKVARRMYYNAFALAFVAIGFLVPAVNAFLHLWCLAVGECIAILNMPAPWNRR